MALAVGEDYFDGTSSPARVRQHFALMKRLGIHYLRCAFSWNALEPSPGDYHWTFWDNLVAEASRSKVELIPYVAYTPKWAAAAPDTDFWSQPPRTSQLFSDFIFQIVSRYKGKIHSWEIWNEPDNRDYWRGTPAQYAALVREAAIRMRAADPNVVIVLGGMSRGPSAFFQSLVSNEHIGRVVDVIAMHGYPETWDQERAETVYQNWIREMKKLIDADSPSVGFWVNEMGYADYRFSPGQASKWGVSITYNYEHSRTYAADFLLKSEIMALGSRSASLSGWYRLNDFSPKAQPFSQDEVNYHLGLVDEKGKEKPSFQAMRLFARLFSAPVEILAAPASSASDVELYAFRMHSGEVAVAGWLRSPDPANQPSSGNLADERLERANIALPCRRLSGLREYDASGRRHPVQGVYSHGSLRGIPLQGDKVFVAIGTCRN